MRALVDLWGQCLEERWVHPLIALTAFNLDFLCIHPFRDGNGRVSRLLLLLQCYHLGFEVGRYISLERLIEQNKERYYETLEQSSQRWHDGRHDPWPYLNYVLFILKSAYQERESMTLKIERAAEEELVVFALSGRIEAALTVELQKLIDLEADNRSIVLDLRQVQLVDQDTVRFLARCEAGGIKLANCPAYIREWILRERAVK